MSKTGVNAGYVRLLSVLQRQARMDARDAGLRFLKALAERRASHGAGK
jgi:hypothetical protein